jgi:hypothetical protein
VKGDIELVIEVPDSTQAFQMVAPWMEKIETIELTGNVSGDNPEWSEWRVVLSNTEDKATIAHIIARVREYGYAAWPYESDDGRGPWSNID